MNAFKTIGKGATVLGVALMAATAAYAQDSTAATGSTDIYTTNFQETVTTGRTDSEGAAVPAGIGSSDIYRTDFQKAFATDGSTGELRDMAAYRGSTDIYRTDFQKGFM